MRRIFIPLAIGTVLIITTFGLLKVARGQILSINQSEIVINTESQGDNTRQITAPEGYQPGASEENQTLISFIDSPTVACVQPDMSRNECYVNWYYMSVNADPNYMITMTVMLNDFGFVSRYHGFFQTGMYVPYNMNPQGYKVDCGVLGSGGVPEWGEAYGWTIRARDSANLKSANYGTVYCPAFTP
jgi:hypothetical protein